MEWTDRFLLRPVSSKDLDAVYYLATKAGVGMTNLPADKTLLKKKIQDSIDSFKRVVKTPDDERYFFVLENTETGKIVGCCGIFASVGDTTPFFSFHVSQEKSVHNDLEIRDNNRFLNLVNDYQGVTEIGSLFLLNRYRKNRLGEFLSRARYLFIGQHRKRFQNTVIAEMRGYLDKHGRSPFWDALGSHFIGSTFKEADRLTGAHYNEFIGELIPKTPIPVALLSEEAQACIGQAFKATQGAVKLLWAEGFEYHHYVDVFDAGPTYEIKTEHIKSIRSMKKLTIAKVAKKVSGDMYLCANSKMHFRAMLGTCQIIDEQLIISVRMAKQLQLNVGDTLAVTPF